MKPLKSVTACICLIFCVSCTPQAPTDLKNEDLIPIPVSINATGNAFELTAKTTIYISNATEELTKTGQYLAGKLNPATGFGVEVKASNESADTGNIYFALIKDEELADEGYELVINEDMVTLKANKPAGLFRGAQTILQLLPANLGKQIAQEGPWRMATGTIRDYPEYGYRGAMLDVSRHFFGVDIVKRYIDLLAFYKLNVLHLHLTDDQGWRIEIKSWPNLTAHGGKTQVGGGEGGFYTQEQYAEIVKYAQDRYIMIIPEIDMPGHTNAALASYEELNCDGKAPELYTGIDVGFSTFCTDKEVTYQFIDDVIRELAAITPGPYIHIGGDESHSTDKEDYIPFVNKVQDIVLSHGKQMIGWDEVVHASLKENSIAQFWASADNAKAALEQNVKVIMSPATRSYLDMQYDSTTRIGLHWAAYVEIDSSYIWEPTAMVPGLNKENILGIESPLWTETVTNMDDIEYLAFPRLPGHAEIGWSPPAQRNWENYKVRLAKHGETMAAMDIDYYPSKLVPWTSQE